MDYRVSSVAIASPLSVSTAADGTATVGLDAGATTGTGNVVRAGSPALTGHPTGVTESASDNSTRLATTAYADAAVAVENSRALTAETLLAPKASPTFTGHPVGVTEAALNNSTRLATTAYVDAAVAVANTRALAAEALLAPLASPTFTGHPVGVTESALNNSTRLATTAYADAAVAVESSRASTAEVLLAPLASPTLTGATLNQLANNTTAITSTRFTDTAPTGNFENYTTHAGAAVWTVDVTGTLTAGTVTTTRLSGTLAAAQFPALTGAITTTAGSLATTLATTMIMLTATSSAISTTETKVITRNPVANVLGTGATFRIVAMGVGTTGVTPGTVTFRIRVGPTTLTGNIPCSVAPALATSVTALPFWFEALLTVRTQGVSGTIIGQCRVFTDSAVATGLFTNATNHGISTATVAVDTTVVNVVELTCQTSQAGSSLTFYSAIIERIVI